MHHYKSAHQQDTPFNLLRHTNHSEEDLRLRRMIEKSMDALDDATRSINENLTAQDGNV